MIDKHDNNNKDVGLKGNNNVIGSKKQDFQTLNANRNNLVSYEETREICVSRKESVFPMETYLDNRKITFIINNDQAANKGYVDGKFITKNCATFSDDVDITNQ